MVKRFTFLILALTTAFLQTNAQCGPTTISGSYNITSNTSLPAGTYNVSGDFTVAAGVTLTINYSNNCAFTVNANNITISGTINANGAGGVGGGGGGAGSSSGGAGGGTEAHGGGGGSAGSGTGGGNVGFSGGNASGGCGINCGSFICTGGNDADRGGGGGGSGGSGGSFGGAGGTGGTGAAGREENEPGNSRCGSTPVPGGASVANSAPSTYNTTADASDLPTGSGGGGAGGGGGGYGGGTTGGTGGNGGGAVNLNAGGNLTVGGVINANGTTGNNGGNGGVRSGGNDYNCDNCSNGNGGGSNTCRDASLCGTCTYYTWGWPGGAGGGAGGGSGGGIKLQCIGIMNISGALTANGGNGGNAGSPKATDGACNHYASGGGAGGGGIIKLVYDPCANNVFNPSAMSANAGTPGLGTDGNVSSNTASTGIVYNQSSNIYFPGYTPFVTPSIASSQTLCSGNTPADLTSSGVGGGIGIYSYQWYSSTTNPLGQTGSSATPANGWTAINGATGATLTGASIGAISITTYYLLQVQSGPCYVWTNVVTISINPSPTINAVNTTNVLCNGGNNGSISVSLSGGTQPYSYSDNGGTSYQNNFLFSGLTAGNYSLYVKDANNCAVTYGSNPIVIQQPAALTQVDSAFSASCGNVNDGSIVVHASGGTAPYSYSLNGGANQPGNSFFGQSAGTYTVQVTDANACFSTAQVTVNAAYVVTASLVNKTNVSCFGGSDGTATLALTGGIAPYSYSINGVTFQPGATFTGLAAGNYVGTIKDSHGCTDFVLVQITQPNLLTVQIDTLTNVACHDSATGAINIAVIGGTAPFTFHWSNNSSTQNISHLTAGTYNVTVVDSKGCSTYSGATVSQPLALFVNVASYHNLGCYNDSSASIQTAASGGTPPYAFVWSNQSTYQNIFGLQPGTYTLTVNDAGGCVATISQAVTQPTQLTGTITGTNVSCASTTSGAINFTLSGGTPGYTYLWSNGSATQNQTGIGAGTYVVMAHDAHGCAFNDSITLTGALTPLVANLATISPTCHGTNSGTIIGVVTGGSQPYTYNWNTSAHTTSIANLPAGDYALTVTDAAGCSVVVNDTLKQTDSLYVSATVNGAKCFNTSSGAVVAGVRGGVPPYTYLVNGIQQVTDTFNNLNAGNYSVLVIDANGCQATSSFVVASPSAFSVHLAVTEQSILTNMQTQLIATPTSTSPIVKYIWSPITEDSMDIFSYGSCTDTSNCSTPYVKPPFTTTFSVSVMTADSCFASDTITVNVKNQPIAFIPTAFTPNGDGLNDRFQFAILGANTVEVSVFDRWGERIFYNANQSNTVAGTDGWDGTLKGKIAPEDTYVYQLKVTYFDGAVKNLAGTITLMR